MTDTAAAQLTPAMCTLADLQYGMLTHAQAAAGAGSEHFPASLVADGLAEQVRDTVIRLRAGGHHPQAEIYAAWLALEDLSRHITSDPARSGIASGSTALVLYGLTPQYSPIHEFTVWRPDDDADAVLDDEDYPDDTHVWWSATAPKWHLVADVPTTAPAETILDICGRLNPWELNDLARGFVERHHVDAQQLHRELTAGVEQLLNELGKPCPDLQAANSWPNRVMRGLLKT